MRTMQRRVTHLVFDLFLLVVPAFALSLQSIAEELDVYQDIETVEVTAKALSASQPGGTRINIEEDELEFLHPVTLVDALTKVPSVNIRTNSRGETLASIRGSGERQLALFWDGIPVNVPWDNRFDLSLIPGLAVKSIRLSTGPAAVGFGANTAAGAVEIQLHDQPESVVQLTGGSGSSYNVEGLLHMASQNVSTVFALSHFQSDGLTAPSSGELELLSREDGLLVNSDRKQTNFISKTEIETGGMQFGIGILYSAAEFGILPEQGPRVDAADARFWRYPDSEHLLTSASILFPVSDNTTASAYVWHQSFDQIIQSFSDASYDQLEAEQRDNNDTTGARILVTSDTTTQSLTVGASGYWSSHTQIDRDRGAGNRAEDRFTHMVGSVSLDYRRVLSPSISMLAGLSYDFMDPRDTAGRENSGRYSGVNAATELSVALDRNWVLRAGAGRKVRLPTMRELFGEAIGRFVLNPDLQPETNWLFEIAASKRFDEGFIEIAPFWVETKGTLEQVRVTVGDMLLRQRVNLPGSHTYGVEARASLQAGARLNLAANITWSRSRAKPESVANSTRRLYLSDRPNLLARFSARYQVGSRSTFGLSVEHRGDAKSEDADRDFVTLQSATKYNLSFRHKFLLARNGSDVELFFELNNLTDKFVEPQLGLPEQGRNGRVGFRASF